MQVRACIWEYAFFCEAVNLKKNRQTESFYGHKNMCREECNKKVHKLTIFSDIYKTKQWQIDVALYIIRVYIYYSLSSLFATHSYTQINNQPTNQPTSTTNETDVEIKKKIKTKKNVQSVTINTINKTKQNKTTTMNEFNNRIADEYCRQMAPQRAD